MQLVTGAAVVGLILSSFWYFALYLSRCNKNIDDESGTTSRFREETMSFRIMIGLSIWSNSWFTLSEVIASLIILIVTITINNTQNRDMTTCRYYPVARCLLNDFLIRTCVYVYRMCLLVFPGFMGNQSRCRYDVNSILPFVTTIFEGGI